ncbi:MotE family protein [Helicobacter sp. 23-1044]
MRIIFMAICCVGWAVCNMIDCSAIFAERKNELQSKLNKIAEQKKMLNILYDEQKRANSDRMEQLKLQEIKVQKLIDEAKMRENEIKNLIKQNEELLAQIDAKKSTKIAETYAKMKDSKASEIFQAMPLNQAAEILFTMDAKSSGKILAKMDAQKAAKLTELLKNGPPFTRDEIDE